MLAQLVVFALMSRHPTYAAALTWAKKELVVAYPYPMFGTWFNLDEAVDRFLHVRRLYGSRPGVMAGLGRCYEQLGDYPDAVTAFRSAGARHIDELRKVRLQLEARSALAKRYPGEGFLQVVPRPGHPGDWGGLTASLDKPDELGHRPDKLPLFVLFKFNPGGKARVLKEVNVDRGSGDGSDEGLFDYRACNLYWMPATQGGESAAVVYRSLPGGDNDTALIDAYLFSGKRLAQHASLMGTFDLGLYPPTRYRPFHVECQTVWHSQWNDVYDWTRKGFRLANFAYPELYRDDWSVSTVQDDPYAVFAVKATNRAIRGRYRASLRYWKKASKSYLEDGVYSAHYGSSEVRAHEARLRIRLLQRRRYRDWRLYVPGALSVQAPPLTPDR